MKIYETLSNKQREELFLLHANTDEYKTQESVYGYQLAGLILHTSK